MSFRSYKMVFLALQLHISERITFVEDQGIGERANLDQAMPIGRVAGEPAHLESHDHACSAQSDFRNEPLKTLALLGRYARLAEVRVDHLYAFQRPSECHLCLAKTASRMNLGELATVLLRKDWNSTFHRKDRDRGMNGRQ